MNQKNIGALQALFGAVFFGFIPFFTLPLYELGYTSDLTLFYRFFTAALIMALVLIVKRQSLRVSLKSLASIGLHGANYFFIALFLFLGLSVADSGIVTTIFYTNPIFVLLLSVIFFKEKLELYKVVLIIVTSISVAMLSGFFSGEVNIGFTGLLFSFLAGLGYAFYIVLLLKLPANDVSRDVFSFYLFFFGALTSFIYMILFTDNLKLATSVQEWGYIFGSAFVTGVVSNMLLIYALPKVGTVYASILGVMEPLTAVFIGVLYFKEEMTLMKAFGIIVVVTAIILLTVIPKLRKNSV